MRESRVAVLIRQALNEELAGLDPSITLDAAAALVRAEAGELDPDELADLSELADEYAEEQQ